MFVYRAVDILCRPNSNAHLKMHLCGELNRKCSYLIRQSSPSSNPSSQADSAIVYIIYWHIQGHKHSHGGSLSPCLSSDVRQWVLRLAVIFYAQCHCVELDFKGKMFFWKESAIKAKQMELVNQYFH